RAASPWPEVIPGARGRFSNALAQQDADAMARLYHNNGFADATVTPVVMRDYRGKPHHIAVEFRVVEGAQVTVQGVTLAGASAAHQAELRGLLTTAPGQPYSPDNVAADRNTILTYYYNQGYQNATCEARATPAGDDGDQDVAFTINEGKVETIHRVLVTGARFVRRNVIAHDLTLTPGRPLSQQAMLQSQQQLYDSGLFTSASVVTANPEGSATAKDVYVNVNEARRYTFSEGIGLQVQGGTGGAPDLRDVLGHTGFSPLLSFDATRTAMTGRPQTLSFKSTYGTLQKRAVLGYDVPNLLNHPSLQGDLTAFYDDTFDIRTFRAIREQAGFQLEQTINSAVGWTYNVDYRRVRVLSPLVAPQEIPILSQPVEVAEVAANYHRDFRDDPLDTHRGSYNSLSISLDKSYGAGFADFTRVGYENHWYHPINRGG